MYHVNEGKPSKHAHEENITATESQANDRDPWPKAQLEHCDQVCPTVLGLVTMATLGARLRQLHVASQQEVPVLPEMSVEELGQRVVKFGNTHRGKTFDHLWSHNQDWIQFMVDRYSQSAKEEHRFLMMYIEKQIGEAEENQTVIPLSRGTTAPTKGTKAIAKGYAKSLAHPKTTPTKPNDVKIPSLPVHTLEPEDLEEEWSELEMVDPSMVAAETQADVQALQARMLNLDNMLEKVVSHLSQGSSQQ